MQRGNIFLTLLVLILIAAGAFFVYKLSLNSLPGQILYPLKESIEELRVTTTELSPVKRALIYIEFANTRLDEIETLDKSKKDPVKIVPVINNFSKNLELSLDQLKIESARIEDKSIVFVNLRDIRERQDQVLSKLLERSPDPPFYEILEIKEKTNSLLLEY